MQCSIYLFLFSCTTGLTAIDIKQDHGIQPQTENSTCKERHHLFYLKIYKTGSSTLTNILNRKALLNNFTICNVGLREPRLKQFLMTKSNPSSDEGYKCDMHTAHTDFVYDKIMQVMHSDTILVATLRHPFENLRSSYYFFQRRRVDLRIQTKGKDPIETLLTSSVFHPQLKQYAFPGKFSFYQNVMSKFFNIDQVQAAMDSAYLRRSIQNIAKHFKMMILCEYYDESLVLLKRMMCWEMKDILYITHKNATRIKPPRRPEDYGLLYERHQNISSVDYALYNHFLEEHKIHSKAAGESLVREVKAFHKTNAIMNDFCWGILRDASAIYNLHHLHNLSSIRIKIESSEFSKDIWITGGDCLLMTCAGDTLYNAIIAMNNPSSCSSDTPTVMLNRKFCNSNSDQFVLKNLPLHVFRNTFHDLITH